MYAFLPKLVITILFMFKFIEGYLLENGLVLLTFVIIDTFSGCKRFEIGDFLGNVFSTGNHMEVILHDYVGIKI